MGLTGMTVGNWRKRYRELGLLGLHDELRPGRPRTYEGDTVADVINRALRTSAPEGSTQWGARSPAAATGVSKTTVHRWLKTFSLQPHRPEDVQALHRSLLRGESAAQRRPVPDPPDKAMVLCVDEKTQIQAMEPTSRCCPWVWAPWRACG